MIEKFFVEMVKFFYDKEFFGYLKMMEEWEWIKCNFDLEISGNVIYFNILIRFYNFIFKCKVNIFE